MYTNLNGKVVQHKKTVLGVQEQMIPLRRKSVAADPVELLPTLNDCEFVVTPKRMFEEIRLANMLIQRGETRPDGSRLQEEMRCISCE